MQQRCALSFVSAGLIACAACADPAPPTERFALVLRAHSPDAEPVAGVRYWADGHELGASSAQGVLEVALLGRSERAIELSVACPAAYRTLEPRRRVVLHRTPAHAALELSTSCEPLDHLAVIVVRARADAPLAGLPIRSDGQVVGQTGPDGCAHVLLRARAGSSLHVALDTSAQAQWSPRNPLQTFELGNEDALLLLDQRFTRIHPPAHAAHARAPRSDGRRPYRIDSAAGL
jgi:hypothetical protein